MQTSINSFFNIDERLLKLNGETIEKCGERFKEIDEVAEYNQLKVLSAFIKNGVSESSMAGSTGYGYDDRGREILERVMADALGAEDALMRHNFVSGTHTLTVALFGILRPNDRVLCLTGRPYDTITGVFGIDERTDGSVAEFGVEDAQVELKADGTPDIDAIKAELKANKYKRRIFSAPEATAQDPALL